MLVLQGHNPFSRPYCLARVRTNTIHIIIKFKDIILNVGFCEALLEEPGKPSCMLINNWCSYVQ